MARLWEGIDPTAQGSRLAGAGSAGQQEEAAVLAEMLQAGDELAAGGGVKEIRRLDRLGKRQTAEIEGGLDHGYSSLCVAKDTGRLRRSLSIGSRGFKVSAGLPAANSVRDEGSERGERSSTVWPIHSGGTS